MITRTYVKIIVTVCFTFISFIAPMSFGISVSQEVSAKLKLEAGLDERTRALIQGMPKEVREQAILALKEALPLIDESVEKYLAEVDVIVTRQLATIDCSINGITKTTIEELMAGFKFWKEGPTMVEDLRSRANKLPSRFNWKSSPEDYRIFYGDTLQAARTVACANKDTPTSYKEVEVIRNRLTNDVLPFERLRGNVCTTSESCIRSLKAAISEEIKKADARDLQASKVITRFDAIKKISHFSFNQPHYVESVRDLFSISDEVRLLGAVRSARFEAEMNLAKTKNEEFKTKLNSAKLAGANDYNAQSNALTNLYSLTESEKQTALSALDNAKELIPNRSADITVIRAEIIQVFDEAPRLTSSLHSSAATLRNTMESNCKDPCEGEKSQFCPDYKRAKRSECM
jgi:hypothetical protein